MSIFVKEETATNAAAPRSSECSRCYCHREKYEKTDPKTGCSRGKEQRSWSVRLRALTCAFLRELRLPFPQHFFPGLYPYPPALTEDSIPPLRHPSSMVCADGRWARRMCWLGSQISLFFWPVLAAMLLPGRVLQCHPLLGAWDTAVPAKLKGGWRIRSMNREWGRTMVLQEPVTLLVVATARNTVSPADKQNWDPTYVGRKLMCSWGSGLVPTVWMVPAYIKAALPRYC